jgi:hypothetical protein
MFIVFNMAVACDLKSTKQSDNTIQHINPVSLTVTKTVQHINQVSLNVVVDVFVIQLSVQLQVAQTVAS